MVIQFWHFIGGREGTALQEIIDHFNHTHPDIQVECSTLQFNTNQKILSSIVAGIPPDLLMVDRPLTAKWAIRGALTDLSPFLKTASIDTHTFFEFTWNEVRYRNGIYAIPWWTDARAMIYNKDLFIQAGLDPNHPPRTWDELYNYAIRLTKKDSHGRITQLGMQAPFDFFMLYAWQLGGSLTSSHNTKITINSPAYAEALRYYMKYINTIGRENYLRFMAAQAGAVTGQEAFLTGKVGISDSSYTVLIDMYKSKINYGLCPVPTPHGEPPLTWSAGYALGIPRGAKHPELSWQLIQYLLSDEVQRKIAKWRNNIPVKRDVARQFYAKEKPQYFILVQLLDNAKTYPVVPVVQEIWEELFWAFEQVIYKNAVPEQVLKEAEERVQKELNTYFEVEKYPKINLSRYRNPVLLLCLVGIIGWGILIWYRSRQAQVLKREMYDGYLFALPWFIGFFIFTLYPLIDSMIYSFCHYQILTSARWLGLQNYIDLLSKDHLFRKSLWNTVYYTVFGVPLGITIALFLAVLLNQKVKAIGIFRTVFYLPTLVTGVAVSVLWMWILNPNYGLINSLLWKWFGIQGPLWINSELWSKPSLILMSLWGIGGSMLIFLAGLQGIPSQLYEAAEIDGANIWRQFWAITVPLLSPTLFFILVVGIIGSFQVFTQAYVMTNGGPADSTLFYVYYLYREAFEQFHMGYASAMAWILFLIILIFTLIQLYLGKKWVHY